MDFEFIKEHSGDKVSELYLRFPVMKTEIIQIECRKRFADKLSDYISHQQFIFPSVLSGEQASNQHVARFNASLIPQGSRVIDMTSGLGIDSMSIASNGCIVDSFDIDSDKSTALVHNTHIMGIHTITVHCSDSVEYLKNQASNVDCIFVDPARRSESGSRLYILTETIPDIVGNFDLISSKCKLLIIKASPLVDITECHRLLPNLSAVYVVSYKGECKEVLLVCGSDVSKGVFAVELNSDGMQRIIKVRDDVIPKIKSQSFPIVKKKEEILGKYLYEPGAALMKIGDREAIINMFPSFKALSPNTRLYLSEDFINDFPGKVFGNLTFPDKKHLKSLQSGRLNVISRNHPLSATQIEKKYKLKSGKSDFLIGCRITSYETPEFILATRLQN